MKKKSIQLLVFKIGVSTTFIVLGVFFGFYEVYAQQGFQPVAAGGIDAETLLSDVRGWFRSLPTLLITIELLVVMVSGLRFMMEPDNQADRQRWGRALMFGIVALFVTLAVWGLIGFISSTTGIGIGGDVKPPVIQVDNN